MVSGGYVKSGVANIIHDFHIPPNIAKAIEIETTKIFCKIKGADTMKKETKTTIDYGWEELADIERDVIEFIEQMPIEPEFDGCIKITIEYIPPIKADKGS